jgi:hypothetical protein
MSPLTSASGRFIGSEIQAISPNISSCDEKNALFVAYKKAAKRLFAGSVSDCLEKPPQKPLRLSHIYHSPGCGCSYSTSFSANGR